MKQEREKERMQSAIQKDSWRERERGGGGWSVREYSKQVSTASSVLLFTNVRERVRERASREEQRVGFSAWQGPQNDLRRAKQCRASREIIEFEQKRERERRDATPRAFTHRFVKLIHILYTYCFVLYYIRIRRCTVAIDLNTRNPNCI